VTRAIAASATAQPSVRAGASWGEKRWAAPLAAACGLVLLAATVEIVLDAALERSPLIPHQPHTATWLQALGGERLGYRVFLIALIASCGAYAILLALVRSRASVREESTSLRASAPETATERTISRWAIGLVAALNLIVFAGPILISTDVFSYLAYARMGVVHGVNPYLNGPIAISGDPVYRYVGHDWLRVATAYGPLYTLTTYPLGLLGVVGGLWAMKVYALLASAATLVLTWRLAVRRGRDRVFALLAVGANPIYVIYTFGGAHNDLVMLALMMGAVALALADRDGLAGATVVAGALVKATLGALLPFMLLARRRLSTLYGALAALSLSAIAAYAAFGVQGLNIVSALNRDSALVSTDSFPNELAHMVGKPGVYPVDHDLLKGGLAVVLVYLLWRTWRGYDWVAASGWALLAIAVTSTWLLPWYILWPLPLAVITGDRRLLYATLFIQGLFVIHQTAPLWVPVQ
jgi:Glycosyltransferase family 87